MSNLMPLLTPLDLSLEAVRYLRQPSTIRSHARQITDAVRQGRSSFFRFHEERFDPLVKLTAQHIQANYPDLQVPLHSRLRHFEWKGKDLLSPITQALKGDPSEWGRVLTELVILSVFVDAGAGAQWQYRTTLDDQEVMLSRSEGLAIASLEAYSQGLFSKDPVQEPWRVDAQALIDLRPDAFAEAFQVSSSNPLLGVENRCDLLRRVGKVIQSDAAFAQNRLGDFFTVIAANKKTVTGESVLLAVLEHFSSIWEPSFIAQGHRLGDVWRHPAVTSAQHGCEGLVPFHKLSQWLSYSLIEVLMRSGVSVTDVNALTALAEYRNGGLLVDSGLLAVLSQSKEPLDLRSETIVEWRALTITLMDELLEKVRTFLKRTPEQLSMGAFLQGGTWSLGRQLAFERRPDGSPPLTLRSDGTLF